MTSIQPELWVAPAAEAITFYQRAFGARVVHRVGDEEDIVAQLAIGDASFWIATASPDDGRYDARELGGATARVMLIVEDPDAVHARALTAGAHLRSAVADEHGWRVGRIIDPFGHEWEIARALGAWPPGTRTG